jgi:metal-responsive CopG/Arc/MetJ family transcriptional regulator
MMGTTYNDKTMKVGITLPRSLVKQTDKTRGDVKRSTFILRAIENYLKQGNVRRPLRESQNLEAPVVRSGSHNETTRPVIVI